MWSSHKALLSFSGTGLVESAESLQETEEQRLEETVAHPSPSSPFRHRILKLET